MPIPDPEAVSSRPHVHPVSFVRRSDRLTPRQERAMVEHGTRYILDVPRSAGRTSVDPNIELSPDAVFGRTAPLTVEIGSGLGDAIVAAADAHPERDYLAIEVYFPGVAQTVRKAARLGLGNLRILAANAPEVLATTLPAASVDELWVFFPDPWHKTRHRKRRLVNAEFAQLVTRVLRPARGADRGGVLRLATDWADYARQMRRVLDEAPGLVNAEGAGKDAPRFAGRVVTGFERKAHSAGRQIVDLTYRVR